MSVPPFLEHLHRDRRGIPVPWVNRWGTEDLARVRLDHDPHVGGLAVFNDDDPHGAPDFTRQHMARQRQAVAEGLCQVCGRHIPLSRRRLVVADLSVERIPVRTPTRRYTVPAVTEPWLDDRCATFAVQRCPALIRRSRSEALRIVEITSKRQVQIIASVGYVDGPLEAESRARRPIMWLKIVIASEATS